MPRQEAQKYEIPTVSAMHLRPHFLFQAFLLFISAMLMLACEKEDENPVILVSRTTEIRLEDYQFFLERNYPEILELLEPTAKVVDAQTDQEDSDPEDREDNPSATLAGQEKDREQEKILDEIQSHIFDMFKRDVLLAEIDQYLGFRVKDNQVDEVIKSHLSILVPPAISKEREALIRRSVRRRLAIRQFLVREIMKGVTVHDEDVSAYYEENKDDFKREPLYRVRFAQMATEDQAEAFRKALRKKKDEFTTLASDYAENEGYLLAVAMPLHEFSDTFRDTVKKMKAGSYSKVIKAATKTPQEEVDYFYVLYLESIMPDVQLSYEDAYFHVLNNLRKQRSERRLRETLEKFQQQIPLEVKLENLPFSYIEQEKRKEV